MYNQHSHFPSRAEFLTMASVSEYWQSFTPPIFALAPMENVTDTVFRRIVRQCGSPHVFFTEFTRVEQVAAYPRRGLPWRMRFREEEERPLVVQIWGTNPELYHRSAAIIADLGYDGVDINMGCPVLKIRNKGSCSGLIVNPSLAAEIVQATREGARSGGQGIPVSVKTRIGYDRPATEDWIGFLLQQQIDLLTVHGRTAYQESEGPVAYDEIARAVRLRDAVAPRTRILANGDIRSVVDGMRVISLTGADGVMIGRGIFADPFLFSHLNGRARNYNDLSADEKIGLMRRHILLHQDSWAGERNYDVLKRFYKIYLVGFDGAAELRERLNQTADYSSALREIEHFERTGSHAEQRNCTEQARRSGSTVVR